MPINALCDYHDIISVAGILVPDGYSNVKTHYKIVLNEDGKIVNIIDIREVEIRGKKKQKNPRIEVLPKREETSKIFAHLLDIRSRYIFGLDVKEIIKPEGKDKENVFITTDKSLLSFELMKAKNMEFLDGIDTPIVNAYRKFISSWNPEKEVNNPILKHIDRFMLSNYIFCLDGSPECVLHKDEKVLEKWESVYFNSEDEEPPVYAQCPITGKVERVARLHDKIKNLNKGQSSGNVLVCFNNPCDESYGKKQGYNCGMSITAMKKYTRALNYLLEDKKHHVSFNDLNIVFFAMNASEQNEKLLQDAIFGNPNNVDVEQTTDMFYSLMKDVGDGILTEKMLNEIENIDESVDFHMIGLRPNASRISVIFNNKNKFADVMKNVVKHQQDMCITKDFEPVYICQIANALAIQKEKKGKNENDSVHSTLLSNIVESILNGRPYPQFLFNDIVIRFRKEVNASHYITRIRTGIIKACLIRNFKKEVSVLLDKDNTNTAYLWGRLFAVLERMQECTDDGTMNKTIKDSYFFSASSTPALVYSALLQLNVAHSRKLFRKNPALSTWYEKIKQEIIGKLGTEIPAFLSVVDQGIFCLGYYQQRQDFFTKKDKENENNEEKENN